MAALPGRSLQTPGRGVALAAVGAGFAVALPVFGANAIRSAEPTMFRTWDAESQALVLGRIQQSRAGDAPAWGLSTPEPDHFAPYSTFDSGGPAAASAQFVPYESQLGLQGYVFGALDQVGCNTVDCLTAVGASLFSLVFVVFVAVLAFLTSRGLGAAVLVVTMLSPWVVAAGHNLYWVPWTWLLPAVAAGCLALARTARARWAAGIALFATVALKAGCGYEFITSVVLLAAAMPVLAAAFDRITKREALRLTLLVLGVGGAAFASILTAHAVVAGAGSFIEGVQAILADAARRTYGPQRADLDPGTLQSLQIDPLAVLGIYVFQWQTDLLDIGVGTRVPVTIGRWGLPAFITAALLAVATSAVLRDLRWRRDLAILVVLALPPLSWLILAKSHAYTAVGMCYVIWYFLLVPATVWLIASTAARHLPPWAPRFSTRISWRAS